MVERKRPDPVPVYERWPVCWLMMLVGGYFGAFTYSVRGGVFCNAQTGNFVLLALALGQREWARAVYYLIPITAYCLGAFVSEGAEQQMQKLRHLRWETILVLVEMTAVAMLGSIPESVPLQVTHVTVNFIASMQYNTFRRINGVAVSTTFCTNHIRQVGVALWGQVEGNPNGKKLGVHLGMLGAFVLGGAVSAALCIPFRGKAIWFSEIPLGVVLAQLLREDLRRKQRS